MTHWRPLELAYSSGLWSQRRTYYLPPGEVKHVSIRTTIHHIRLTPSYA
eukprot:SAG22_NODE_7276_length_755_cov_1.253049_1_plen_48_part_10